MSDELLDLIGFDPFEISEWKRYGRKDTRRKRSRLDQRKGDRHLPISDDPHASRYSNGVFVMLDGEGVTHHEGAPQSYVAMGSSMGDEIFGWSLSTEDCFNFLLDVKAKHGPCIYTAFAFKYDVSMMLRDLPPSKIKRIMKCKPTHWRHYRIEYIPNKKFYLRDKERGISITVYDVFTFFGKGLIPASHEYLCKVEDCPGADDPEKCVDDIPNYTQIVKGKAARNVFSYAELNTFILPYMRVELLLAVSLINKLRDAFTVAQIKPTQWSGPGSVAAAVLKKNKVKDSFCKDTPAEVIEASQYAYFGGHFEQYYCGHYADKVYSYDIRSAYPFAASLLPNLSRGKWIHTAGHSYPRNPFAVVKVMFITGEKSDVTAAYPIPFRSKNDCIRYPPNVISWVWFPEIRTLSKWCMENKVRLHILEKWEFVEDDVNDKPFAFINELYESRAENKRNGNPAQYAQKISLNSLYGKLAQQKGKDVFGKWVKKEWQAGKPPPFHCLEYAGYITSICRAMVWDAMSQNIDAIISVNTDGIYSTAPLDLEIGPGLGQWEFELYDEILSVQAGMYFLKKNGKWSTARTRGIPKKSFPVELAIQTVASLSPIETKAVRFHGGSYAGSVHFNRWEETPGKYDWGGNGGKRTHKPETCPACISGVGNWHRTSTDNIGGPSHKHKLPWIDNERSQYVQDDEEIGDEYYDSY